MNFFYFYGKMLISYIFLQVNVQLLKIYVPFEKLDVLRFFIEKCEYRKKVFLEKFRNVKYFI